MPPRRASVDHEFSAWDCAPYAPRNRAAKNPLQPFDEISIAERAADLLGPVGNERGEIADVFQHRLGIREYGDV